MENIKHNDQSNNPMHGVKLVTVLEVLLAEYSWEEMAQKVNINCFKSNPTVNSSLKFLRQHQWARDKVELVYLDLIRKKAKSNSQKKVD